MTSSSPPEAPSFSRGKTLTPESPRPLHIPEAANIPVLQNQIDPIFNLMSTHMEPPYGLRDLTAMDHQMARDRSHGNQSSSADTSDNFTDGTKHEHVDSSAAGGEEISMTLGKENVGMELNHSESSLNQIQNSFLANQHSTTMASFDQPPLPTIPTTDPIPTSHSLTKDSSSKHATDPPEPSQESQMNDPNMTLVPEAEQELEATGNNEHDADAANVQALLDNIVAPVELQSTTTVPSAVSHVDADVGVQTPSNSLAPSILPAPAGLPPRPPPQEKPVPGGIRPYHFPHAPQSNSQSSHPPQPSNSYRPPQSYATPMAATAPGTMPGANGLPPPPMASFQQPIKSQDQSRNSPGEQQFRPVDGPVNHGSRTIRPSEGNGDPSWSPDVQRKYEEFLDDEKIYTAEGTWDKFPPGSRLFVGNLPSEVTSKRDIFEIFHRYGRLAQISIKQAYGFVQYLDASACQAAMHAEQGGRLKDRNMHLEISKPPKNARNAQSTAAGDSLRATYYKRARSPDYGRQPHPRAGGPRNGADRFTDFRDEPRRRDDYRPGRSPSPRGFRGRDEYRGRNRSPDRYFGAHNRSRSPHYGRGPTRYRSPSPRRRPTDDEELLPFPRRDARDVPDVQLILIDDLDRAFVTYIEKAFRDRGLRCSALSLPHAPLAAVVKRQILEGVQAVVKMYRASQVNGKIPLQVFDRSGGVDQVRFEEYEDLDAHIAAEVVIRKKVAQAASHQSQSQYTAPMQGYGGAPYLQQPQYQLPSQLSPVQQQPASGAGQPNLASLITSLDGPALQKLLGAMQQNPQTPTIPQQHISHHTPTHSQDLATILGGVNRQQAPSNQPPPQQAYPYQAQQLLPQAVQQQPVQHLFTNPTQTAQPPQFQQPQANTQQQVQSIMEQLSKWKK